MARVRIFFLITLMYLTLTHPIVWAESEPQGPDISLKEASMFYAYVADRVHREYVEPTSNAQLLEGSLNGMLTSLDPHSAYLSPEKFREVRNQTEGKFAGIGLEITVEDGYIKIVSAMEDSPGQKAGLTTGDLIVMIDKQPVFGISNVDAAKKLRGKPGSHVHLVVRRGEQTPFEITIKRDTINIKPIKWRLEDKIGYIRIVN
ncbi:MAG: S41 family peptidase, partial [Candidatus Nucleicultricaceae bacterium]